MRFTVRELVYIGIFGALWGAIEITSGSLLHVLNVPFAGLMLSGVGIAIALIGRRFVPRRGSVLCIGVVTALLKMFSLGGIVINPMIGIIAESLLAEAVLSAFGRPRRASFVLAGALAVFWSFVHPFFTQGLLAGAGMVTIYTRTVEKGAGLLGIDPLLVGLVLAALVAVHWLIGAVAGWIAWDAGRLVEVRLRPAASQHA